MEDNKRNNQQADAQGRADERADECFAELHDDEPPPLDRGARLATSPQNDQQAIAQVCRPKPSRDQKRLNATRASQPAERLKSAPN
jgi:hypothetical protein